MLFVLVLCLTGLPLVFDTEIDRALTGQATPAAAASDAPLVSLDQLARQARRLHPGQAITAMFIQDDQTKVEVSVAPYVDSPASLQHGVSFDAHTGRLLADAAAGSPAKSRFMQTLFSLHTDWFVGLTGKLFLAVMGSLFVIATVSGVVLYAPFMKKLSFGAIRVGRTSRLRWLDLHDLLGIATAGWVSVVGLTGVINELADPLYSQWQRTEVNSLAASSEARPDYAAMSLASAQVAINAARQALPGMTVSSISFPGNPFGSAHHYLVWTRGNEPVTRHLYSPVLVDPHTAKLVSIVRMPWYLRALEVSRPLHFGDYGGTPLKVIWAALDMVTLIILGSGLYLWLARHHRAEARVQKLLAAHSAGGAAGRS